MSNFKSQNPNSVLDIIQKKQGIDQAEVYISSTKTNKVDVLNQQVESIDELHETGLAIRIIKDHKLGFAYTSDFSEEVLEETVEQAIANASGVEADEFHSLPKNIKIEELKNLELYDTKIAKTPVEKKIKLALAIEKAAYAADKRIKKTEKISYSDSETSIWLANSNGLDLSYKVNYCGASAQVISQENNEMESGFGLEYSHKLEEIDPDKIGREAAMQATELLGGKPIPSQKMPLVLDPLIGAELLGVLASTLSSDATQKGKSLFIGKLGQIVGAKILNIIDNGRLPKGLASSPFDAEGVATQETQLIESGILRNFLYNTYTARREDTESTGNAIRGSYSSLPAVAPTNFYIKPGDDSAEQIIQSVNKGLYVTRVMGIHTINPISGDFSIAASGLLIENGKKTLPVKGVTIAGNLIEMLEKIEAIGNDLRFVPYLASLGSPTLLIADISISGH